MIGLLVAIAIVIATTTYFLLSKSSTKKEQPPTKKEDTKAPTTTTTTKSTKKTTSTTKPPKKTHKPKPKSTHHPKFIRRFGGHSANISSFAISPSGEWMATAGLDSQIRISHVNKNKPHEFVQHHIDDHDRLSSLSWENDGRTVAGGCHRSGDVRFYRVRKKQPNEKDTKQNQQSTFPYELVELVKRRFNTFSKLDDISACVADQSSSSFHLLLTSGESAAQQNQKLTAAWDGSIDKHGESLGLVKTGGSGNVVLSTDGTFFCGRGGGKMSEVKLFEIQRKKVKGDVKPHFDKISSKSVMTLFVNAKVMDVAFLYNHDHVDDSSKHCCDRALVVTAEGIVQLWDLDVEYKLKEDPKLLCCTDVLEGKGVVAMDSSFEVDKFAIVTRDCALHVFSLNKSSSSSEKKYEIKLDFTIEGVHTGGVGDVLFCPKGDFVYTRSAAGKDVFAWKAT